MPFLSEFIFTHPLYGFWVVVLFKVFHPLFLHFQQLYWDNLHTVKFTHFKCTVQCCLIYLQSCAVSPQSNFRTFPFLQKPNLGLISNLRTFLLRAIFSHSGFGLHPLMLISSSFSFSCIYTVLISSLHINCEVLAALFWSCFFFPHFEWFT